MLNLLLAAVVTHQHFAGREKPLHFLKCGNRAVTVPPPCRHIRRSQEDHDLKYFSLIRIFVQKSYYNLTYPSC